jgi:hypothetical protein
MWNLNDDNELDNLSREAAESFPLDQSPGSWNKIHARLDAEMPEERRRRYLLFFLFVLVIGSGVFWISRMNGANDQSGSYESTIIKNDPTETATSEKSSTSALQSNKPAANKKVTPPSSVQQPKSGEPSTTSASIDGTPNANNQTSTNVSLANKNTSTSYNKPQKVVNKKNNNSSKAGISLGATTAKANNPKGSKNQKVVDASDDVVANQQVNDGSTGTSTSPKNDQPTAQTIDKTDKSDKKVNEEVAEASKKSEPHEKEAPSRDNIRWTFGAVYAPDISTVNFTHTQPAGLNIGVTIDYRLSQKFSLQTAFIYTKKNYKLNGEDYHPPKGTWFDYVRMQDVTGSCSMYDIPLNFRYNAVRKKSSNIFFTAGLSSYLMKNEQYSYYYHYNNGTPGWRDRSYSTNDDYLFSIINFSAGFEKNLNRSFSLQVEPFFKQTLTGVGFGDISLNSTGIYFSLRYNPLKPSKTIAENKK